MRPLGKNRLRASIVCRKRKGALAKLAEAMTTLGLEVTGVNFFTLSGVSRILLCMEVRRWPFSALIPHPTFVLRRRTDGRPSLVPFDANNQGEGRLCGRRRQSERPAAEGDLTDAAGDQLRASPECLALFFLL